jgi:hypothetical protein
VLRVPRVARIQHPRLLDHERNEQQSHTRRHTIISLEVFRVCDGSQEPADIGVTWDSQG